MKVQHAILDLLNQINRVLVQIEPMDYRRPLPEFDQSTLGQHFRHALEFFICLEKGYPTGLIDYASRERNLLFEDNPSIAMAAFEAFVTQLSSFDADKIIQVRSEFGVEERPQYASTLGRELLFVYDHAIHHLAIIKIGLRCHFPEIQTEKDLGVSPSTIKARKQESA
jgi:hypothetical protein